MEICVKGVVTRNEKLTHNSHKIIEFLFKPFKRRLSVFYARVAFDHLSFSDFGAKLQFVCFVVLLLKNLAVIICVFVKYRLLRRLTCKNVRHTYSWQAIRTTHRSRSDRTWQNYGGTKIF